MRADAREWLDQLAASQPAKNRVWQGVAGVANAATPDHNTAPHSAPHLETAAKAQQYQRATPATPCHTPNLEGGGERHTREHPGEGVAACGSEVLQPAGTPVPTTQSELSSAFDQIAAPMLGHLCEIAKRSKARGTVVEAEPWRRSKRTNKEPVTFFTISAVTKSVKASVGPLISLGDKLTIGAPYQRFIVASTFGRGSENLRDHGGRWPQWIVVVDGDHASAAFPTSPDAFDLWFSGWIDENKTLGDWRDEARADGALHWLQETGGGCDA